MKALTMGEMMIQLNPITSGPLRYVSLFEKHVAGSEGNVAIGLSRLGNTVEIITILGEDEFGENILSVLKAENVGTSYVFFDKGHPTGVYFIQRDFPFQEAVEVFYYRSDSAMANIQPDIVDKVDLNSFEVFHTSGITPLLSENCEKAVGRILERVISRRILFSFDTNVRRKLIKSREEVIKSFKVLVENADILFTGLGDLMFITGRNVNDVEDLLSDFKKTFSIKDSSIVVVKMGSRGSICWQGGEVFHQEAIKVKPLDTVGAGDAFDAAFLSFFLEKGDVSFALRRAAFAGAIVTIMRGDYEAFPKREEIEKGLRALENGDLR